MCALDVARSGEAVKIVDELLQEAVRQGASDIHVEPKEARVVVRYRIDGVMVMRRALPPENAASVTARLKILGKMDIAERRLPQDGTFEVLAGGRVISCRCSSFPTPHGEKIVVRLLQGGATRPLAQLGMLPDQLRAVHGFVRSSGGLVLVTGPTGSGKTSTLYAALKAMDTRRRNVVTLEDPIEVQLPEITQGQVHPKIGFDFARGLRSVLRQDPDVILVGEMRDRETAEVALRASLTGHLVLSTLHTASPVETVARLLDIGLEGHVVAGALLGIVAQRLARRACESCSEPTGEPASELAELGFECAAEGGWVSSPGCPDCLHTGFKGRLGLFDVVEVDDAFRDLIKHSSARTELKRLLARKGLPTLRRRGVELARAGHTTLEEVLRVT